MHYQFLVPNSHDLSAALEELKSLALHSLYTIEDQQLIIGGLGNLRELPKLSQLISQSDESIDWQAQWASFAPNFDGTYAHIPFNDKSIKLLPGPGFGDLSHPTTQLMSQAMQEVSLGESILDIGCGSGILSCFALHSNVKRFYIVDIDPAAIDHARQNMQLNAPDVKPVYSTTIDPSWVKADTILINMILPEQQSVFEMYPFLKNFSGSIIGSGLLKSQFPDYLTDIQVQQIWEKDGWIALHFFL